MPPPNPLSPDKTFCEFFAGVGLLREGLQSSGWECVYANDIDPKKRLAYAARFGSDDFHLGDVADTGAVVDRVPGRPFLATASFPCVDLSLAGHYRGLHGGTQSSAVFGFMNVLEALGPRRPPVVLLENVPGFLTSRGGDDFAAAASRLAELGYWLDAFVLDACHFTPQSRPRVFVVGAVGRLAPTAVPEPGRLFPSDVKTPHRPANLARIRATPKLKTGWLTLPLPPLPTRTLRLADVIDTDAGQEWWSAEEVARHAAMMSDPHRRRVGVILEAGEPWVGTIFRRIRAHVQRAEVRFDGLAGCLRTPRGGSARQIVVSADRGRLRMRWMSPREYARLQGVPDFPLTGTTTQQLWGFGDAVCVPAVRWIDRHVLTPLHLMARGESVPAAA